MFKKLFKKKIVTLEERIGGLITTIQTELDEVKAEQESALDVFRTTFNRLERTKDRAKSKIAVIETHVTDLLNVKNGLMVTVDKCNKAQENIKPFIA